MALKRVPDMYFEDFDVGDEAVSSGRTITETDVVAFAALSGDYNPLHTDAEYCRNTLFGERIAHGLLGLSVAMGLIARLGFMERSVQAFLGLDWKFRAPIKIGDTIRAKVKVARTREMGDQGGLVTLDVSILNQRDEVVQRGQWNALAKRRPKDEPAEE